MGRLLLLTGLLAAFLAGCGSGDTTTGAAESAAEMAKKSEGSQALSAEDQAVLNRASGPGGGTAMKKGGR